MTHGFIKEVLFSPTVVSISLITGGIAILIIERLSLTAKHESIKQFSWPLALKIGFCQTLAMIPGVSRSGASIMGAMLLGVERKTATEFSFFLAIPTMFGAVVYDLYKNLEYLDAKDAEIIAVGFVMAFLAGLVVVKHLIAFISKHGFTPFGYYRIAIGSIMLILLSGS
jgi:undecaprenyl-diphosphatase